MVMERKENKEGAIEEEGREGSQYAKQRNPKNHLQGLKLMWSGKAMPRRVPR